jgi:hypothetical protein
MDGLTQLLDSSVSTGEPRPLCYRAHVDERLRALERQAASGDLEAEAALLRHRLAIGDLTEKRLRLAAYLGHPPARRIYGKRLRPDRQEISKWIRGVRHFGGVEAGLRAALAAAEQTLDIWEREFPEDARPRRALEAARACLESPGIDRFEEAAREAGDAAYSAGEESAPRRWGATEVRASRRARAARVARAVGQLAQAVGTGARGSLWERWQSPGSTFKELLDPRILRRVVQRALIPWALG